MENNELIEKTVRAYCTIFPELYDDYINNNDNSIVNIIRDKIIDKSKTFIDVNEIEKKVKNILNSQ